MKSDESLVGTPAGVVRARTIRRLPPAERGDKELLMAIRGTVWRPVPADEGDEIPAVVSIRAPAVVPASALPAPQEPRVPVQTGPRRVYIRKDKELVKYGYTNACPGCYAAENGLTAAAHSEACRNRIEAAMTADEADKTRIEMSKEKKQRKTEDVDMTAPTSGAAAGSSSSSSTAAAPSAPRALKAGTAGRDDESPKRAKVVSSSMDVDPAAVSSASASAILVETAEDHEINELTVTINALMPTVRAGKADVVELFCPGDFRS